MKRIISLLLACAIMLSTTTKALAADTGEEYYTIPVEYSDNMGTKEELNVMIQNDNVFVDAEMLAERLGYTFGENGQVAVISNTDTSNGLPFGVTQFQYGSTQVSHMVFTKMIHTYEAPFASVKNSEGSWIPFEYSLLLINSGMMITDDALLIDVPAKRITDYFCDIANNSKKYTFDWAEDFGYTDTEVKVLGGNSHMVNVFNGVLELDGASWSTIFQQLAGSMASYDKKYGEHLALLLCTESDKELQETINKVDMFLDVLDENGELGKTLSKTADVLDSDVGVLYKNCEDILEKVKSGNSTLASYNRSYQALEKALDKQTWFSNTGGNILEVQKGMSDAAGEAFRILDVGTKVLEVVGYAEEFLNHDEFSLAALEYYLDSADGGLDLPEAMKKSMVDYADVLSGNIGEYMTKRFLDNVDQWVKESGVVPMNKVLGGQAVVALFAWNIASNTIPFVANGMSGADSFELALYSLVFQGDAFLNYLDKRGEVFNGSGNITAKNLYDVAQYCYIYLKSCYITREAAIASLANRTSATKEKIQPLIDYQNDINEEIAKILVELKAANKTNEGCVFGFLPSDNREYLNDYSDAKLALWIRSRFLVTDAYSKEFGGRKFNIPRINLNSDAAKKVNEEIWTTLYDGVVTNVLNSWQQYHYDGGEYIKYHWHVNEDVLSLVIESHPVDAHWVDYYVYNFSISTGEKLSSDEVIALSKLSLTEYYNLVKEALKTKFNQENRIDTKRLEHDEVLYAQLVKTVSDENIKSCIPYFGEDGQLCVIGVVYSAMAGADYYYYDLSLEPGPYALYAELLEGYEEKYGEAHTVKMNDGYSMEFVAGMGLIQLIDFDQDGIEELFLVRGKTKTNTSYNGTVSRYPEYIVEIWSYINGKIQKAFSGDVMFASDVSRSVVFIERPEATYYLNGMIGYETDCEYWGLENGRFETVRSERNELDSAVPEFYIDGKAVSQSEWSSSIQSWRGVETRYDLLGDNLSDVLQMTAKTREILGME